MRYDKATRQQLRHKRWMRVVGVLACLVVFVTAYALVLPAVTLERDVVDSPDAQTLSENLVTESELPGEAGLPSAPESDDVSAAENSEPADAPAVAEEEVTIADAALLAAKVPEGEPTEPLSDGQDDSELAYIRVQKVFSGIQQSQIPADFAVQVGSYTLTKSSPYYEGASDDGLTLSWKLDGLGTGTYSVSESNFEIADYNVASEGTGNVTVQAGGIEITGLSQRYNSCSELSFTLSDTNAFVAKCTSGEIAVVTKNSLSASQRAAILEAVPDLGGNLKTWTEALFYSAQNMQDHETLYMRGVPVTVDFENLSFTFPKTSVWTQCGYVYAEPISAHNADILITNTYTPKVSTVTVSKVDEAGQPLQGATFGLFTDEACTKPLMINDAAATAVTGTDGKAVFENVPVSADYWLKETAAPEGYELNTTVYPVTFGGASAPVSVGPVANVHKPIDVSILKVDKNTKEPLPGAKFALTRSDTQDGTFTAYPAEGSNIFETNENGLATMSLPKGYYKLVEVQAPDGYILTNKEIAFHILDGVITLDSADADYATLSGVMITATNEPGTPLPETGGIGNTLYTISGLALIAFAAMLFVIRRRKVA